VRFALAARFAANNTKQYGSAAILSEDPPALLSRFLPRHVIFHNVGL
jgi:hypothetical protein